MIESVSVISGNENRIAAPSNRTRDKSRRLHVTSPTPPSLVCRMSTEWHNADNASSLKSFTCTVFLYPHVNAAKAFANTIYHTNRPLSSQSLHARTCTRYLSFKRCLSTGCVIGWHATKVSKCYDTATKSSKRRNVGLELYYARSFLAQSQE